MTSTTIKTITSATIIILESIISWVETSIKGTLLLSAYGASPFLGVHLTHID